MNPTNHQPLLTVIVPCYNVEKYVDKCISSIVNQTYSNLEILLIDDGSTDTTGTLCDAWQERDQRIRVIHKQNEGLSYARKTGVENTDAEYVAFVDSDDWIDPNMYADMMSAMISTDSDIAQCEFCEVFEDGRLEHHSPDSNANSFEIVGREEGVLLIVHDDKWKSFMWNKIFKKHLFDHIVFPKGRVYEDYPIMHSLFHHASLSVYLSAEYYFYYRRSDSITNSKSLAAKMKNSFDFSEARLERYLFIRQHSEYHKVLPFIQREAIIKGIGFLRMMMIHPQYFSKEEIADRVEQLRSIPFPRGEKLQRGVKIELCLLKISPKIYKFLRAFYIQILRVTNTLKITNKKW